MFMEVFSENLEQTRNPKVCVLLSELQDIFSKGSHDLGCFNEIKHSTNTEDEKLVKHPIKRNKNK